MQSGSVAGTWCAFARVEANACCLLYKLMNAVWARALLDLGTIKDNDACY